MKANRSLYFRPKWYYHHHLRKCRCAFGAFGVTIQRRSIFPNKVGVPYLGNKVKQQKKTSGKEKEKKKKNAGGEKRSNRSSREIARNNRCLFVEDGGLSP